MQHPYILKLWIVDLFSIYVYSINDVDIPSYDT